MTKQAGVTLIELIIVLVIIGVVASISYPSFQEILRVNRIETQTTRLLSTLMAARSEAAKTNQPVVVCKSADGVFCTDMGNWDQGWLVFRDEDAGGDLDAGDEPIIRVENAVPEDVTVRALEAAFADSLGYAPDGTVNGAITQIFKICAGTTVRGARTIVIEATGRPRVDRKPGGTCPE